MSRIVNENYFDKLNSTLSGFDFSINLNSLIDFFEEQIKIDQTRNGSKNQMLFSQKDLNFLQQIKESLRTKRILSYLYKLINSFDGINLQIHLNINLEDVVSNQIVFLLTWDALINSRFDDNEIRIDIEALNSELNRDIIMHNNNKHELNRILREAKGKRFRIKFLQKIETLIKNQIANGWLINLNKGDFNTIYISEFSQLSKTECAFINFGESRKGIFKEIGQVKLERFSNILNLFPSITGKNIWYKDFISNEINRYSNFKKIITITSGEKTPDALLEMQKQNKFQVEEFYTIFPFEL